MGQQRFNNQIIQADPKSGHVLTGRQLEILFALNPYKFKGTYKEAARTLDVSVGEVKKQMSCLKIRCPVFYKRFKKLKKKLKAKKCKVGDINFNRPMSLNLGSNKERTQEVISMCYLPEDAHYIDFSEKKKDKYNNYKKLQIKEIF